jgi:hypothetical protein
MSTPLAERQRHPPGMRPGRRIPPVRHVADRLLENHETANDRNQPHRRADREIDAAGDDDRRHTERHHPDEGEVSRDVEEIVLGREHRLPIAHHATDHGKRDRDPERLIAKHPFEKRLFVRIETRVGERCSFLAEGGLCFNRHGSPR